MKKQLRLVLFAALIMILVMMTALVASAATDGAEVREEGHYYEVVSAADGAVPKYYTTLATAVGAVDADGYTITVLGNVTEPALALAGDYTYKITGGVDGATITFNTVDSKKALINISAGKVTLESLTVVYDTAAITSNPAAVVYISGASEITLDNFVTSAAVTDTVSVNAAATVTVSGDKTDISGGTNSFAKIPSAGNGTEFTVSGGKITADKYVMYLGTATTIQLTGGTLTGSSSQAVFYAIASGGSDITISNATVVSGATKAVFAGIRAKHTISLLEGTTIIANNSTMFGGLHSTDSSITLNGAELHLSGSGAVLATSVLNVTNTAGKVLVKNGAAVPAETLDKTETQNGFDWSVLSLVFPSYAGPCEITEGEHNIASLEDNQKLAKDAFLAAYSTRFPNAEVEITGWIPLVLNGADAVLNITAGEYVLNGTSLVEVKAGTLNITGGTVTGAEGNALLSVQGGTVNLAGGTIVGGVGSTVLSVTGGTVNLTGAAVTGSANGSVAVVTGGAVNYVKGTVVAGANGITFNGTVSLEGAEQRLENHHYAVATDANATPKYYTTLAKAIAVIDADGYIITVLGEVTEAATTLNVDYAYTITGGAQGATLAFSSTLTVNAKSVLLNLVAGKVALQNLTVTYNSNTGVSDLYSVVIVTGAGAELALSNTVINAIVTDTFHVVAASKITVLGNKTDISGATGALFRLAMGSGNTEISIAAGKLASGGSIVAMVSDDVSVFITGGTFTSGTAAPAFSAANNTGAVISIANATVTANDTLLQTISAEATLKLLAGANVTVNNATAFVAVEKTSTVEFNGADLYLEGEYAILCADDSTTIEVTPTAGTLHIGKEAATPAVALDALFGNWGTIAVEFGNYTPVYKIKAAGTYNFASAADVQNAARIAAKADFEAEYLLRFPLAQLKMPDWIMVVIDNSEAVVNFTAGQYDFAGVALVTIKAGTLNISNGTYNVLAAGCLIDHQGGTVNISGGSFKGADDSKAHVIYSTATADSAINISGGTFAAWCVVNAEGKVTVTVSDGTFAPVSRASASYTLYVHHADAKLNVTGGTFEDMARAVWAAKGEVTISGGKFYTGLRVSGNDLGDGFVTLVYVDGPAKVAISGSPEFQLKKDNTKQAAVYISANAGEAEVNISGGAFGGVDLVAKSNMF